MEKSIKIQEGSWNDNVSWEFYLTNTLPERELCTAVFCLAIVKPTNRVVLARNQRGWEMLGGHIEPGESIEEALEREALEEGGFRADNYQLFGYRKVIAKAPVANTQHGGNYPPVAYIPHYYASTEMPLLPPTGEEIFESRTFEISELPKLNPSEESILLAAIEQYSKTEQSD